MSDLRQAQDARRVAFEQMLADARADLARRTSLPGAVDRAVAIARADAPLIDSMGATIDRVLPQAAHEAIGGGVRHRKIWERDVKPLPGRKVDGGAFITRVYQAVRTRKKGDPSELTLVTVAKIVLRDHHASVGFARLTFEQISFRARRCKETARQAIRWLERHNLIDTLNVLTRVQGFVGRVANLYLIPTDVAKSKGPAEPARQAADSIIGRLGRYAALFGLKVRRWGFNATPSPAGFWPSPERQGPS
jgi:hypothetical protein